MYVRKATNVASLSIIQRVAGPKTRRVTLYERNSNFSDKYATRLDVFHELIFIPVFVKCIYSFKGKRSR